MSSERSLELKVHAVRYEAQGIFSFELRPVVPGDLPVFSPGAHIDLALPGDLGRSYSLVGSPDERHRYVIAVSRDANSRGGSKYMCETLRPGDHLMADAPKNNFELAEAAPLSVFIGGGIGITPLWCMIGRLQQLGRPWKLFYATRTRAQMPFLEDIEALAQKSPDSVHLTFDQEPGNRMLDLPGIVAAQPVGTHFYCCGPGGMLKAFEAATSSVPAEQVHVEYFSSDTAPAAGGFRVVLARSKKTIMVAAGQSILQAIQAEGIRVSHSCKEGVCGTCETRLLEGIPDHRDKVLSRRERESNRKIMICCSGALSEQLVLDL